MARLRVSLSTNIDLLSPGGSATELSNLVVIYQNDRLV